ncbi:MAG: DUF3604 domain-containing protein [Gammaproteobacteria bacterium]
MAVRALLGLALCAALPPGAHAAEGATANAGGSYSPYVGERLPMNVYWGDLHVHTAYSIDANVAGNQRIEPEDAYRFARGEEVTAQNGMRVRLGRPLDFLMVSDHGEYLGLLHRIDAGDAELMKSDVLRRWRDLRLQGQSGVVIREWGQYMHDRSRPRLTGEAFARSVWEAYTEIADRYNAPGRFTALIGYEWTASPEGDNLHRNVVFRDGADTARRVLPFTAVDSNRPEDLWRYMAEYEARTGGEVLDIPHNSNLSGGRMFQTLDSDGRPFTRDYAQQRARWEPIVEATQIKGDSESHRYLSPADEFADYGDWDWSNIGGSKPHRDEWFKHEYVRSALGLGLAIEARLGVNPFKFGLIGSTDTHTGLSTVEEDNFWGKMALNEPHAERADEPWAGRIADVATGGAATNMFSQPAAVLLDSGYAAIWATENTREALFAALKRRETYATTGSRMVVRFFGGWRFTPQDAASPRLARLGYSKGVPMGGDLVRAPDGAAPTFLVHAARDPDGANLDRAQIIKVWLDAAGEPRERIYDVAVAGGRAIDADGRARAAVGSTVDVESATYRNTIGAPELAAVWRDPDFDAHQRALYYLRVIEIPTPRWTAYDARHFGTPPPQAHAIEQDRAYTSPIWYTPGP